MIFVFGSNLAGRHGAGAALYARRNHYAIWGQGSGLQGNSYAIPTKDHSIKTLPLDAIRVFVNRFLEFARNRADLEFQVTRVGCGLAGYKNTDIALMFRGASANCHFDPEWEDYVRLETKQTPRPLGADEAPSLS